MTPDVASHDEGQVLFRGDVFAMAMIMYVCVYPSSKAVGVDARFDLQTLMLVGRSVAVHAGLYCEYRWETFTDLPLYPDLRDSEVPKHVMGGGRQVES